MGRERSERTKRRYRRASFAFDVLLKTPGLDSMASGQGTTIGAGGMFVATKLPSPVGTTLDFQLVLHELGASVLSGSGEVRWVRASGACRRGERPGMGIAFRDLSADSVARIDRLVRMKADAAESRAAQAAGAREIFDGVDENELLSGISEAEPPAVETVAVPQADIDLALSRIFVESWPTKPPELPNQAGIKTDKLEKLPRAGVDSAPEVELDVAPGEAAFLFEDESGTALPEPEPAPSTDDLVPSEEVIVEILEEDMEVPEPAPLPPLDIKRRAAAQAPPSPPAPPPAPAPGTGADIVIGTPIAVPAEIDGKSFEEQVESAVDTMFDFLPVAKADPVVRKLSAPPAPPARPAAAPSRPKAETSTSARPTPPSLPPPTPAAPPAKPRTDPRAPRSTSMEEDFEQEVSEAVEARFTPGTAGKIGAPAASPAPKPAAPVRTQAPGPAKPDAIATARSPRADPTIPFDLPIEDDLEIVYGDIDADGDRDVEPDEEAAPPLARRARSAPVPQPARDSPTIPVPPPVRSTPAPPMKAPPPEPAAARNVPKAAPPSPAAQKAANPLAPLSMDPESLIAATPARRPPGSSPSAPVSLAPVSLAPAQPSRPKDGASKPAPPEPPAKKAAPAPPRSRGLAIIVVVGLLVVGAIGVGIVTRKQGGSDATPAPTPATIAPPPTEEPPPSPVPVPATPAIPSKRITKIDTSADAEGFHVLLSGDGTSFSFRTEAIDGPPRFVLELQAEGIDEKRTKIPVESKSVASIRVGRDPGIVRIVLDLKGRSPVEVKDRGAVLDVLVR